MASLLEHIRKAEKRIWVIAREDVLWDIKEHINMALKKTFEGIDVRIIIDNMKDLTRIVKDFELVNKTTVRNLGVVDAPVLDVLYIIDDRAWRRVDGRLTEIDVKEAEVEFKEFWNKYRMKTLLSGAKKRVLAAIPRINRDDARALIEKAASDVDVYIITNDKSILTSTMERIVRDNDRRLTRAKRLSKFKSLMASTPMLTLAVLIGIPILVSQVVPPTYAEFLSKNEILDFLLTASYMFVGALGVYVSVSYAVRLKNEAMTELKNAEEAFKVAKKASKRLNVLEVPITEEFYVVDDRAWAVREDGRLIEADAISAERKFAELWRLYEGPWVLGKDVK